MPHDVHLGGKEGVGRTHHRADIHVVLEVLDSDVEGMPPRVEIGDDRLDGPVAIAVDDIAGITVCQQLWIVPGVGVRIHARTLEGNARLRP